MADVQPQLAPQCLGWLAGRWLRFRDSLCRVGLHWPVRWEMSVNGRLEELICQRPDCRDVVRRRAVASRSGEAGHDE